MIYLTDNNILYKYQSDFCKNHSPNTSLSYLTQKILTSFESGLFTGRILVGFEKAFYTVNHDVLLRKLSSLRFSNHSIMWFQSYLSDRHFRVNVKSRYSLLLKLNVEYHKDLSYELYCFFHT